MAVDIEKYNEILYYSLISFQKEQNRIIVGELNNLNTIIKFFSKQEKKIQNPKNNITNNKINASIMLLLFQNLHTLQLILLINLKV